MKPELSKAANSTLRKAETIFGAVFKIFGTIFLIILTTGSILAVIFSIYVSQYLTVDMGIDLKNYSLKQTSTVVYIDKETGVEYELDKLHGQENRVLAEYNEIPAHMIEALVSIEDKRFFQHQGVDWKRTIGAFAQMFLPGGDSYGGSTITQQLIKNLTDEKDFTVSRKIQEILRALEFEKYYSKEEILEWYLNTCYFGQGCYGVKTAAQTYFGKDLNDLTLAESACIIGITNKPTLYNPYLNPEKNKKRQEDILHEMMVQGKLTDSEYSRAINETLAFVSVVDDDGYFQDLGYIQSYYTDQVVFDVKNDLVEKLGISKQNADMQIYSGGLKIYAAIDMRVQNVIDEVYANDENFPVVKNSEKPQSSLMVIDPYNGDILGFAGGRGVKTGNLVQNLPNMSQRQPGSSIKPVTVYSAAMEMGIITPYSVVDDAPSSNNGAVWPRNSGGQYKGRTNIITAVQNSVNTIAVRVVEMMTPTKSFYFGRDVLGLKSLVEERWVTKSNGAKTMMSDIDRGPLALGGLTKGLTVRELTAAYATFVNKGIYNSPRTYTKITQMVNNQEVVILDNSPEPEVAIKEKTAYYMNTVLKQVVTSGTGSRAKLASGITAAGKTGTTSDDFDRWFIGYTPYYACGSWFGFTMPKKISLEQSTNPALTMWKLVMDELHTDLEQKDFFTPDGLVNASYCLDSGMVPTENCRLDPRGSRVATGTYDQADVPKTPCNVHQIVNVDKESGKLATPYCPEENLTRVALLNISRPMASSGVYVWDEQYVVRYFGGGGPAVSEGMFSPVAAGADGAEAYNTFCPLHQTADQISTPSSIPEEETDPTMPNEEGTPAPTPTTAPTPTPAPDPNDPDFIPED